MFDTDLDIYFYENNEINDEFWVGYFDLISQGHHCSTYNTIFKEYLLFINHMNTGNYNRLVDFLKLIRKHQKSQQGILFMIYCHRFCLEESDLRKLVVNYESEDSFSILDKFKFPDLTCQNIIIFRYNYIEVYQNQFLDVGVFTVEYENIKSIELFRDGYFGKDFDIVLKLLNGKNYIIRLAKELYEFVILKLMCASQFSHFNITLDSTNKETLKQYVQSLVDRSELYKQLHTDEREKQYDYESYIIPIKERQDIVVLKQYIEDNFYRVTIEDMNFSQFTYQKLSSLGIRYLFEILESTKEEIKKSHILRERVSDEIVKKIDNLGLQFTSPEETRNHLTYNFLE